MHDASEGAVHDSTSPVNEKEKKSRWQGLLPSSKVSSSFSRRPSIPDDTVMRVQTEIVMMRRLQSSVTYKLALLESHMHRHEDAKVCHCSQLSFSNICCPFRLFFSVPLRVCLANVQRQSSASSCRCNHAWSRVSVSRACPLVALPSIQPHTLSDT